MRIYKATIEQFEELWKYSKSNTYEYFLKGLNDNVIEFWTIEINNQLIAELYIFWDSIDKEEANGIDRAYLCAFRVNKDYQGKGYGGLLMKRFLDRIKENGYTQATVGIDNREYKKLSSMYNKFGFTQVVKETNIDNHYLDELGNPVKYKEPYRIVLCSIGGM